MGSEYVGLPLLLAGGLLLFALLIGALVLVSGIRKKRALFDETPEVPAQFPFPQRTGVLGSGVSLPKGDPEAHEAAIVEAYKDWLVRFVLPDLEAGRSFVRSGVDKNWLRYQVSAESLDQGLAMLISLVMAGSDLGAQARFDRLAAFCLAHPSADFPELVSWKTLPDVAGYRRADADFHAELWISLALMGALRQWQVSDRFHYDVLLAEKLAALQRLVEMRMQNAASQSGLVSAPFFFDRIGRFTGEPFWQELTQRLESQADAQTGPEAFPGTERAAFAFLHAGLAGLVGGAVPAAQWERRIEASLQAAETLPGAETPANAPDENPTSLTALACCVPAALCLQKPALTERLQHWLESNPPQKEDPRGASLRLLGLMMLSGNAWFLNAGMLGEQEPSVPDPQDG